MKYRITAFLASLFSFFSLSSTRIPARIEPSFDTKPDASGLSVYPVVQLRASNKPIDIIGMSPAYQLMSDLGAAKINGRPLPTAESRKIQEEIIQAAVERRRRRALRA